MIAELLTVCSENFHVDSSLKTVHTVYILQTGTEFSKKNYIAYHQFWQLNAVGRQKRFSSMTYSACWTQMLPRK